MTRKKVKLAWMVNENSRATSLKNMMRLGLVNKVRELTILCDVKACLIMLWPSVEAARDLLDDLFALPEFEKKKKETTLESYLKEKTRRFHEQLRKSQKKNMKHVIDQLRVQRSGDRIIADLNLNKIYELLYFSKDKIMHLRKRLDFVQHLPLRDPPMHPFGTQSEELRTTKDDIF